MSRTVTKGVVLWGFGAWLILLVWVFLSLEWESREDTNSSKTINRRSRDPPTTAKNPGYVDREKSLVRELVAARKQVKELESKLKECRNHCTKDDGNGPERARCVDGYGSKPEVTLQKRDPPRSDVCQETFISSKHGYPFFRTGFVTKGCKRLKPLSALVTVVLVVNRPAVTQQRILDIIGTFEGIAVHVVTSSAVKLSFDAHPNVTFLQVKKTIGQSLKEVVRVLYTDYVFVAVNLLNATYVDLNRLVRIYGHYSVAAVGGSVRYAETGKWSYGCYQTSLQNYTLRYTSGYRQSYNECMVCDALDSAFLTTPKELETALDSRMTTDFLDDTFLTWFEGKNKLLSCPDVMVDVSKEVEVRPEEFVVFANKRELNRWVIDGGQDIWFGCRRGTVHVPQGIGCRIRSGIAVPPCCIEGLADSIKLFMRFCEKHNIICELQEGTLLGAVKLRGVLPWERDADITFLSGNYSALKDLGRELSSLGFTLSEALSYHQWCCADGRQAGGAFRLVAHSWTIELWGQHLMDSEMRILRGEKPSKVLFAGEWVNVPDNPGLYARNRYGPDNLRHAQHWMATGKSSGWDTYNPGKFSACPQPGHHSCLDQFCADGSFAFR